MRERESSIFLGFFEEIHLFIENAFFGIKTDRFPNRFRVYFSSVSIHFPKPHPAQHNPLQTANRAGCSPCKR